MNRIEGWLATSPNATLLKVALVAAIGAIASYVATANVHPLIVAICAAVAPVIINWCNSMDGRYGRGAAEYEPFDVWGEE